MTWFARKNSKGGGLWTESHAQVGPYGEMVLVYIQPYKMMLYGRPCMMMLL